MAPSRKKDSPEKKMKELADSIREHQRRYYIENAPTITDREFDRLLDELRELEKKHPEFKEADSPTDLVGSDLEPGFKKFQHTIPVLSLGNTYSGEEAMEWARKVARNENEKYIVQWKVDGATLVLYYENGKLARAVTRGSGQIGDDVTANARTIRNIPHEIKKAASYQIRGEVYMTFEEFQAFNESSGSQYANPRNLTSGSIKQKKADDVARRPLRWVAFDVHGKEGEFASDSKALTTIEKLGFPVFEDNRSVPLKKLEKTIADFTKKKDQVPFPVDGLVLKIDDREYRDELGFTAHSPRWATALKFEPEIGVTVVEEIETFVGRTGRVTPRARLQPVGLAGTTVTYATLHNQDYIQKLGVRVGSTVKVSKRGEIIPAVEEVVDPGPQEPYIFPTHCPSCNTKLVRDEEAADALCPNPECDEKKINSIIFFCARKQMDIAGLGEKAIRNFYEKGLIKEIDDIYNLEKHAELIESLPGYGKKSMEIIRRGIEESRSRSFRKVLPSLGLRELGPAVTDILLKNGIHSIDDLFKAIKKTGALEEFQNMDGIGPRTAQLLIEGLGDPKNAKLIKSLKKHGLHLSLEESEIQNHAPKSDFFAGQSWCVTGKFDHFKPRDRAMELIVQGSGKATGSVTGKTTHLLAGEGAGSKLEKAQKQKTTIVSEAEFLEMLEKAGLPHS